MSSRKRRLEESRREGSMFSAPQSSSLSDTDSAIFGEIASIEEEQVRAVPVSIFEITPHRSQPRRALPSGVASRWGGDPYKLRDVFAQWLAMVEEERGTTLNLEPYLLAEEEVERLVKAGMLETAFLDLVELAASIRRDGLTNPITVVPIGDQYLLETGERRWLAYHLLYSFFDDSKWQRIPARIVDELSVWRQASENNARANLNAISRARQFAVLLMDLLAEDAEVFKTYQEVLAEGGTELEYYAQVADGTMYRVPRGKGEQLLNAMGLKHPQQLREYRELLRLPFEVWQIADDFDWPQRRIRSLIRQAKDDADLIRLAKEAAGLVDTVGMPTVEEPKLPMPVRRMYTAFNELRHSQDKLDELRDTNPQEYIRFVETLVQLGEWARDLAKDLP